ncbi:MAG: Mth938-like domain-containing protein [Hylemonella sp.]|nr:Mth938-like domain-containing protein [Hylemonella sp.]MDH5708188.1 Mth938-like domain-containing protein [Hylemonella sp.]
MKLHHDNFTVPVITGHGPGWLELGHQRFTHSLVINSRGSHFDWACPGFNALEPGHFERLSELKPEVVLFGSGSRQSFPDPAWLASLTALRIGVETMDTGAACRTYNILAGEGRHVLAALLLETP